MKLSLLIAAGLLTVAALLPAVRRSPEAEAHAPSKPGKAAMRERVLPRETATAARDPRQSAAELLAAAANQAPGAEFDRSIALWADRAPLEVLEWLDATGRGDLDDARTAALAALAWESPEQAATWLERHPDHAGLTNWQAVIAPWGESAPAAAHAWVVEHLEADMQEALRPMMLATFRQPGVTAAILGEGVSDTDLIDVARGATNGDRAFAEMLISWVKADGLRQAAVERLARHRNIHGGLEQVVGMEE